MVRAAGKIPLFLGCWKSRLREGDEDTWNNESITPGICALFLKAWNVPFPLPRAMQYAQHAIWTLGVGRLLM
jgi:hypothetical protein